MHIEISLVYIKVHVNVLIYLMKCISDAVVIVGDLVDGPVKQLEESSQSLTNIISKYGTYYVTGSF